MEGTAWCAQRTTQCPMLGLGMDIRHLRPTDSVLTFDWALHSGVDWKIGVFLEGWKRTLMALVIWSKRRVPVRWRRFPVRWHAILLDWPPCMGGMVCHCRRNDWWTDGCFSPPPFTRQCEPGLQLKNVQMFWEAIRNANQSIWIVTWSLGGEDWKNMASTIHGFQRWMCVLFLLWCLRPRWPLILDLLCVLLSRWS